MAGWYDITKITGIINTLRVFGKKNVAQIKSGEKNADYINLHNLTKTTNLVYRETTSVENTSCGYEGTPEGLRVNIERDLKAFKAEGVGDPCTFCFSMHCRDHYIPMVCRIENGNMEILAVDSMSGSYNAYIDAAIEGAKAAAESLGLSYEVLETIDAPQGDDESCGPLVALVNGMINEKESLISQVSNIKSTVIKNMATTEAKNALRAQQHEVNYVLTTPDESAYKLWVSLYDWPRMSDSEIQGRIDIHIASLKEQLETVNHVANLPSTAPKEVKRLRNEAQKLNHYLNAPEFKNISQFRAAAKESYTQNQQKISHMRESPAAQALLPARFNSKKVENPLKHDKQKEVLSPPKKAAPPKKFGLPSGVELQEKSAAKWLWDLGQEGNEATKNQFVANCNEVLGGLDSSITNIAFAENDGEHKMIVQTPKVSHDIYMTEKGLATEALVPEVYAVMAVAAKKSLPAGTETAIVKVKPSNVDEAQSMQICFDTGLALVNQGLVPQFPTNSSPEFFKDFVNSLGQEQQDQLNESIAKLEAKGVLNPEVAALKSALPKPSVSFELHKAEARPIKGL